MKTTIVRAAVVGALLAAGAANAQEFTTYRPKQSMYILNYEVSSPLGSFSDHYVKDTSWRGISFESRSWMNDMISAGFSFTFNRYSQTYSNLSQPAGNGGTISGPVYRYADQFAVKGLVHAYFLRGGVVEPYVGAGIGGAWTYAFAQTADLSKTDNGFDFIISPEVGLTLTAAKGASSLGLNVALRYNYSTADFGKVNDMQTLALVLGFFGAY